MKKLLLVLILLPGMAFGQSDAMEFIEENYDVGTFGKMVFYYSTLKMWIPEDDAELKEIIHDIDKITLLRLESESISPENMVQIKEELQDQNFEEAVNVRGPGKRLLMYIREGKGVFMMGTYDEQMMILDVVGTIPVDKLFTLQDKLQSLTENTDFLEDFRD